MKRSAFRQRCSLSGGSGEAKTIALSRSYCTGANKGPSGESTLTCKRQRTRTYHYLGVVNSDRVLYEPGGPAPGR